MAAKKSVELAPDTTVDLPLADLRLVKRNPRKGNVGAVAASLKAHGQYRPIVANIGTHTGRRLEVLAGNHTLRAMRKLAQENPKDDRWATIKVHLIDVDDEQAARIVLADNKTSEAGTYDNTALAELLDGLNETANGLEGTGFTLEDLDALAPDLNPEIDNLSDDEYVDEDDLPPAQPGGRGAPIISYAIVFDTVEDKARWIDFMNWLKRKYPDLTPGERVEAYIDDFAGITAEEETTPDD